MVGPDMFQNVVTWEPTFGAIGYRIYSDSDYKTLLVSLPAGATSYIDTDRMPGQTYWYYLLIEYTDGFSSTHGFVKVTPQRTCM